MATNATVPRALRNVARRLNFEFGPAASADLDEVQSRNSVSATEAMRRAIALLALVEREQEAGRVLWITNPDGNNRVRVTLL